MRKSKKKNLNPKTRRSASSRSQKPKAAKKAKDVKAVMGRIGEIEGELDRVLKLTQEKVNQFEQLMQFSEILNSTLDPSRVRERALEATCQLLRCETASLFLVDLEKGDLYWETALGDIGKELQSKVRLEINDQSIAGYVAMTGESLIVNDISRDPRHYSKFKKMPLKKHTKFVSKNMICVPLKAKDKTIGVLQAINKIVSVPQRPSKYDWPEFFEDDLKLLETLSHQVAIAVENAELYQKLKSSFAETVLALAEAIEKKDRYTGGHTKRVVFYSLAIAKYLDLTDEEIEQVRLGAILHDVGKIGIEDRILKKPAPLDSEEWPVMQTHPELGYHIMKKVSGLKDVVAAMRFHHERWDGKGYPLRLKGEEIPLIARIVAVADTYDAMVSTRPYRKGLPPKVAYDEIMKHSDAQFCPTVCQAFEKAYLGGEMGRGSGDTENDQVESGEREENLQEEDLSEEEKKYPEKYPKKYPKKYKDTGS